MSKLLNELLSFLRSNAIAISAFLVSLLALLLSFRSYRHSSRADVEIEVDGNWEFDYVVEKPKENRYEIRDRGKVGEVSVKNKGGVRTTLEALSIAKKGFLDKRRLIIAPLESGWEVIGTKRYDTDFVWLSFNDIIIEPGDRIPLKKSNRRIFELFPKDFFDLSTQDQGEFQLVLKHTFSEEKSNPFRIVLSASALKFLQLECNEQAFIDEYKNKESNEK